jgi:serine/threonine protein kinase
MPQRDLIGEHFGSYRLIRLLGEGGQASVYLGQHIRLVNMQAAVKVASTHISAQGYAKFEEEAQTIAGLIHPRIVRLLEFDLKDGLPFLVMDYAPQGSLRQRHPKGVQLSLKQVVYYIEQVASALQYAHDRKVIHRDVKPENLLIGRQGEILLSDFGIAAIAHNTSCIFRTWQVRSAIWPRNNLGDGPAQRVTSILWVLLPMSGWLANPPLQAH